MRVMLIYVSSVLTSFLWSYEEDRKQISLGSTNSNHFFW